MTGESMRTAERGEAESGDEDCSLCESCAHARFVRGFAEEHIALVSSIARATGATDLLNTIARRADLPPDVVADILTEDGWELARCGTGCFYRVRDEPSTFARLRSRSPRRG